MNQVRKDRLGRPYNTQCGPGSRGPYKKRGRRVVNGVEEKFCRFCKEWHPIKSNHWQPRTTTKYPNSVSYYCKSESRYKNGHSKRIRDPNVIYIKGKAHIEVTCIDCGKTWLKAVHSIKKKQDARVVHAP